MIKIIKTGTPQPPITHEATCRHCGTVFQFNTEDAVYIAGQEGEAMLLRIDCPLDGCDNAVWVSLFQTAKAAQKHSSSES